MSPSEQELVIEHMPLVYFLVNKHFSGYREQEDLIQIGMTALCEAAIKWSPEKGKFSTFAGQVIRYQIWYYLRSTMRDRGKSDVTVVSLDQKQGNDDDSYTIGETVGVDFDWDATSSDFDDFVKSLDGREQQIIDYLKRGYSRTECAKAMGMCNSRITQLAAKIKRDWSKFYDHQD